MRIAAFSDIHGNLAALEAVLADIEGHNVDHLVCLGDVVALGPHPGRVIERLRGLGCPVVQGNTDTWYQEPLPARNRTRMTRIGRILMGLIKRMTIRENPSPPSDPCPTNERQAMILDCYLWLKEQLTPEQHAYLLSLPPQQRIGPVLGVHGSPRDCREGMPPDTPEEELAAMVADVPAGIEVVLGGHVHHPLHRQVGGLTIVGVGSVGLPADGDPRPCYALLERAAGGWRVQWSRPAYDVEAAIAAARVTGFPRLEAIAVAWRSGRGLA